MDGQELPHIKLGLEIELDVIIHLMLITWTMVKKELEFAVDGMNF